MQALFGVDHGARREAVGAASVLSEGYEIGRRADGTQDGVILFAAVAVAMREHGQIAIGERCLAVRDRVECQRRVRDDAFAVPRCDLTMLVDPFGL